MPMGLAPGPAYHRAEDMEDPQSTGTGSRACGTAPGFPSHGTHQEKVI